MSLFSLLPLSHPSIPNNVRVLKATILLQLKNLQSFLVLSNIHTAIQVLSPALEFAFQMLTWRAAPLARNLWKWKEVERQILLLEKVRGERRERERERERSTCPLWTSLLLDIHFPFAQTSLEENEWLPHSKIYELCVCCREDTWDRKIDG